MCTEVDSLRVAYVLLFKEINLAPAQLLARLTVSFVLILLISKFSAPNIAFLAFWLAKTTPTI